MDDGGVNPSLVYAGSGADSCPAAPHGVVKAGFDACVPRAVGVWYWGDEGESVWANPGGIRTRWRQRGFALWSSSRLGGPCVGRGEPGLCVEPLQPPRARCLPRLRRWKPGESGAWRSAKGEAANLIAELKGFEPTAPRGLRAMSGRAVPSPACSCPSSEVRNAAWQRQPWLATPGRLCSAFAVGAALCRGTSVSWGTTG